MSDNIVVGLTLRADGKGFVGEVRLVEAELKKLGVGARRAGSDLYDLGGRADRALAPLRSLQATVAGLGVALAAKRAVQEFAEYEKGLIGVAKTADLTADQVKAMGSAVTDMARRMPFARTELLAIAQAGGQLGVKGVRDLSLFTETIAKLGTASDLAGEEAATSLTRILNVTGESIDRIDEFASVIVALGNNFAATESEIARVTTQVAQATAVFGVSSEQAAGMAAALRSVGVQAELGGSTVGKAFRAIETSIRGGGEQLLDLERITGLTGAELKRTFDEDATAVFQRFVEGIGQAVAGGASAAEMLERFDLQGDEVLKVLPVLAQNSQLLGKALGLAAAEAANATALNEEYLRASTTLSAQLRLAGNAIDEIAAAFGQALAPQIVQSTEDLRAFVQAAIDSGAAAEVFDTIAGAVALLAGNLDVVASLMAGRVGAQLGALVGSIFGPLGTVIGGATGAVVGFGGAMLALDGDIRGTVESYARLGRQADETGTAMATSIDGATQSIIKPGGLLDAVTKAYTKLNDLARRDIEENGLPGTALSDAIVDGTISGLKRLGNSVYGTARAVTDSAMTVVNEPLDVLAGPVFWERIAENVERGLTTDWVHKYFGAATTEGKAEIKAMAEAWQGELDSVNLSLPDESRPSPVGPRKPPIDPGLSPATRDLIEQLDPFSKLLREAADAERLLYGSQDQLTKSGKDLYSLLAVLDHQLDAYQLGLEAAARAAADQARDVTVQAQVRRLETEGTEAARRKILELTTARELERLELQRQQAVAGAQPGQLAAIEAAYAKLRAAINANAAAERTWSTAQAQAFKALRDELDPIGAATRQLAEREQLLNAALKAGKVELVDHAKLTAALRREDELWKRSLGEAARSVREQAADLEHATEIRRLELENTEAAREQIISLTTARKLEQLEIARTTALLEAQPDQIDAVNAAYDRLRRAILDDEQVRQLERIRDQVNPLAEAFKNAAEGIQRGFADAFTEIVRNGELSVKDLAGRAKDIVARMIGELITLAAARPIIIPLVTSLGQTLGLDSAAISAVTRNLGGTGAAGATGAGGAAGPGLLDGLSFARLTGQFFGGQAGGSFGTSLLSGPVGQWLGAPQAAQAASVAAGDFGAVLVQSQTGGWSLLEGGLNNLSDPLTGIAGFGGNFLANLLLGGDRGIGSTIGGTAGGVIGGAVGGPIGAAVGAFAGNALGGLFGGGGPSVGPTTIGRVTDLTDPGGAVVSFDNGGNNEAEIRKIIEAVAASIQAQTQRYGATLRPGSGFDFGLFTGPDSDSSQRAGVNIKAIVGALLEDKDRFKGLTPDKAVEQATLIALQDMVDYQDQVLAAIADNSTATELSEFVKQLDFGRNLVDLRDALESLGVTDLTAALDANTLAIAQDMVARKRAAEERVGAVAQPIVDSIETALELFPRIDATGGTVQDAMRAETNASAVRDVVAIAKASVDQLIGGITGGAEPVVRGPVTTEMETAQAELGALRDYLEQVNEQLRQANEEFPTLDAALYDVGVTLNDAAEAIREQFTERFWDRLQVTENDARGLGAINGLGTLIAARDAMLADAAEFGADAGERIASTFADQVRRQFAGLDANGLAEAFTQTTDEAARQVITSMLDEMFTGVREADIQARRNTLLEAYQREAQALQDLSDRMRSFSLSIGDVINQIKRGEYAKGGPQDRLDEAKRQFDEVFGRAQLGDQDALAGIGTVAQAYLEALQAFRGDRDAYNTGYDLTIDRLEAVKAVADRQASVADRQLTELRAQVSQYAELNDNVVSVEEAIRDLESVAGGGLAALLEANRRPSDAAAERGFSFGTNAERNKGIYDDLVRLGLPTPTGFGQGELNELRQRNAAVNAYLLSRGLEQGGWTTPGSLTRVHNDELVYTGPAAHVFSAKESLALMAAGRGQGSPSIDMEPVVRAMRGTTAAVVETGDAQMSAAVALVGRVDELVATVADQARTIDDLTRELRKRAS